MSCKHCEKEKHNEPLVRRGSRTVKIEKVNETTWGIFMWWRTENGKWHMEWNGIDYCPMCGRKLGDEVLDGNVKPRIDAVFYGVKPKSGTSLPNFKMRGDA